MKVKSVLFSLCECRLKRASKIFYAEMFAMKMTFRNEILISKIDINDDDKKLTISRQWN